MPYNDKQKQKECEAEYRATHREDAIVNAKLYREEHKRVLKEKARIKHEKFPWLRVLVKIRQRCYNKKLKDYKYYGAKGIEVKITVEELKKLWLRDNASLMLKPSIDRVESSENYTFDNCRFMELRQNAKRSN